MLRLSAPLGNVADTKHLTSPPFPPVSSTAQEGAPVEQAPSNEDLADAFDRLASAASTLRRLIPALTLTQLDCVAESAPWSNAGASALLDLDLWAVAAAAGLRDLINIAI